MCVMLKHHHTLFFYYYLLGQSKWKETPESLVNCLPTWYRPLRQCVQQADRKHLHIQVSTSSTPQASFLTNSLFLTELGSSSCKIC